MTRPVCQHCRTNRMTRARGLCWGCSLKPEVRALYSSTAGERAKYGRRSTVKSVGGRSLPPTPTDTLPGSPERVAVLEERAAGGFSLFHPDDTPGPMDPKRRLA